MHTPADIITGLENSINEAMDFFSQVSIDKWDIKREPGKWSRKEIVGHLCDSAMNNLRRFIVSQYEPNNHIIYQQNEWVRLQAYQETPFDDVIMLWKLLNQQIIRILKNLPDDGWQKTCITGEQHTIQYLASDYVSHLNHHVNQIKNYDR